MKPSINAKQDNSWFKQQNGKGVLSESLIQTSVVDYSQSEENPPYICFLRKCQQLSWFVTDHHNLSLQSTTREVLII